MPQYFFGADEGFDHEFRQMQGRLKLGTESAFIRAVRVAAYLIEAECQGKKVVIENRKGKTVEFHCREICKKVNRRAILRRHEDVRYSLESDDEFDSKFRKIRTTLKLSTKGVFTGAVRMVSRLIKAELLEKKKILIKNPDGEIIHFSFFAK